MPTLEERVARLESFHEELIMTEPVPPDVVVMERDRLMFDGEVIDYQGATINGNSLVHYTNGSATIMNANFINAPLVNGKRGRFVKHESTGLLTLINCTFQGAGDEAVLVSNFNGRIIQADLLAIECQFLDNSRNAMISMLSDTSKPGAALRAVFKRCYFRGGFRNPLVRGARAWMYNCFWESGNDSQFRPPMVGTHPFKVGNTSIETPSELYWFGCFGPPPIFEKGLRRGSLIEGDSVRKWPGFAGELSDPLWTMDEIKAGGKDTPAVVIVGTDNSIPADATEITNGGPTITGDWVVRGDTWITNTIEPGDGCRIFFEPGATLDGRCQLETAIASNATDVLITGPGKIRNFKPINQHGVIESRIYTAQQEPAKREDLGLNWIIEQVQISDSTGYAVVMGEETLLDKVKMLRLEHGGFTAHGGTGSKVRDCEVAFINQDRKIDPRWEAGNKIKYTQDFQVVRLNAHHINGSGFWPDIENENSSCLDSVFTDICGPGVQYELSTRPNGGLIRGNYFKRCGRDMDQWMFQAAIQIQNVQGVLVQQNTGDDCFNSVSVIDQQWRGPTTSGVAVQENNFRNSGQAGLNWEGPNTPSLINFNGNEWKVGLSHFLLDQEKQDLAAGRVPYRLAKPFRYGGGFESITAEDWINGTPSVTNERIK